MALNGVCLLRLTPSHRDEEVDKGRVQEKEWCVGEGGVGSGCAHPFVSVFCKTAKSLFLLRRNHAIRRIRACAVQC